jgi:hypothetical protein
LEISGLLALTSIAFAVGAALAWSCFLYPKSDVQIMVKCLYHFFRWLKELDFGQLLFVQRQLDLLMATIIFADWSRRS